MPGGKLQFQYRPSQTRGGANHGWLKTSHTFSFADYYDPAFASFGSLRVINEDRVAPGTGFPTHPHREFEIFSYIVSGELTHKDNMGNVEIMRRGDVQMTSGGTGIAHSEYNDNQSQEVHFLQIWAKPNQHGLKPQYYTRHFADDQKTDILREIVAPVSQDKVQDAREGDGPTPVHSAFHVFASLLNPGKSLKHTYKPTLRGDGPKLFYAQLVQTSGYNTAAAPKDASKGALVKLSSGDNQVTLGEGDGVFVRGGETGDGIDIENIGQLRGELILFEMDG